LALHIIRRFLLRFLFFHLNPKNKFQIQEQYNHSIVVIKYNDISKERKIKMAQYKIPADSNLKYMPLVYFLPKDLLYINAQRFGLCLVICVKF